MKLIAITLILISLSCSRKDCEITGNYKYQINYFDKIKYYKSHFLGGSTLTLNSDSTFNYKTCGMLSSGNWRVLNDSLYLYILNKRFRIDSLNYSPKWKKYLAHSDAAVKFKIGNDRLDFQIKEKGKSYVEILYKNN